MSPEERKARAEMAADGVFATHRRFVEDELVKRIPAGSKAIPAVKTIVRAPGWIANGAELWTADDKARAIAGIAGGTLGGLAGGLAGPIGAGVGSVAGEAIAEGLYEHRSEIADGLRRGAGSIDDWMKARAHDVMGRQLDRTYRAYGR